MVMPSSESFVLSGWNKVHLLLGACLNIAFLLHSRNEEKTTGQQVGFHFVKTSLPGQIKKGKMRELNKEVW